MDFFQINNIDIVRNIPELIAWGVGIYLAVLTLRRGGRITERLLLAGCCLMFFTALASPVVSAFIQSVIWEQGMSNIEKAQAMSLSRIPLSVLDLAGLVCLIWAFWARFWIKRSEAA